MQQRSSTPRRKLHRRQVVAYYRGLPTDNEGESIAAQREIIATWATENDLEIVEEVIDRRLDAKPAECNVAVGGMIQKHATKQGGTLYVLRMDAGLWRLWRRSDTSLQFHKLSKNQGDRAVFATTDLDTAGFLYWSILLASVDHCDVAQRRARIAAARRRKRA